MAFIDRSTPDLPTLLANIRSDVEAIVLDERRPAAEQIERVLSGRRGLAAVHVVAHGAPGRVCFSGGEWKRPGLKKDARRLAAIGSALADGGELRLWCCETAAGQEGEAFVLALTEATGAQISATTTLVGSSAKGGAWTLPAKPRASPARPPITRAGISTFDGILATKSWVGGTGVDGNDWATAANWISASVPGATDDIVISAVTGGILEPTISSAADTTVSSLTLNNGASLTFSGAFALTLDGTGTTSGVNNSGTIALDSGTINVTSANGSLVNSGAISLSGGTLETGALGGIVNTGAITGAGAISAAVSGSGGTITATGGTLVLGGSVASGQTFDIGTSASSNLEFNAIATVASAISLTNANQTLTLGGAGALTLGSAESLSSGAIVFAGGILTDAAGLTLGSGATLSGHGVAAANISASAGVITANGGTLELRGTLANTGTFSLAVGATTGDTLLLDGISAAASVNYLGSTGVLDIGASGALTLSAPLAIGADRLSLDGSGSTLTDTSGVTLSGGSIVGYGQLGAGTNLSGYGEIYDPLFSPGAITASGGRLVFLGAAGSKAATTFHIANVANTVLKFDGAVGASTITPTVVFDGGAGAAGVLDLSDLAGGLANFHATVSGLAEGEGIEIAGAASASLNGTGSTLTVYNAANVALGALTLASSYSGDTFNVSGGLVSVDELIPTLSSSSPETGVQISVASVANNGTPVTTGLTYQWNLNGAAIANASGPNYTPTANEAGALSVTVNYSGNPFSESTTVAAGVIVDPNAPSIAITSAAEISNQAAQTITGNVTPVGLATVVGQTVTLMDNGAFLASAVVQSNGGFSAATTLPNQGANKIVATVSDSAGNAGVSTPVGDALDSATPAISLSGLLSGAAVAGREVVATLNDQFAPAPNDIGYTWQLNGSTVATGLGLNDFTPTAAETGETLTVSAAFTDTYGFAQSAGASAGAVAASLAPAHVVVLSLENENYDDVIGNNLAPYLNSLATQGMVLTNGSGMTHPSQPNYIALFSGSLQGVTGNVVPQQFSASVPTLASALVANGDTFGGYAESASPTNPAADPQREPWLDFANSAGYAHSFSDFPQTAAGFAALPTVSFITPNDNNNMTPFSDNGGGVAAGDAWVQTNISAYAAWAKANNSLLIVTFDENNTNPQVTYPDHIATVVVGSGVPAGSQNSEPVNTYSLLASIESLYGLTPIGETATSPILSFYSASPNLVASTLTNLPPGISDPSNYPPQNALAVGPNYILSSESAKIQWTNRATNQTTSESLYALFAADPNIGTTLSLLDARAVFDSASGLYVLTAIEYDTVGGQINIDVATSSDPSKGWSVASLLTGSTSTDMPGLTVGQSNIYLTSQVAGGETDAYVVPLASIVNGAALKAGAAGVTESANVNDGSLYAVSGASSYTYLFAAYTNGTHTSLSYQTYDAATRQFSATQTIGLPNSDAASNNGADFVANQAGTTEQLDAGSRKIASLAYASIGGRDYVFGVSEVQPNGAPQPEFEWFEFDVTNATDGVTPPAFVQGGNISPASLSFGADVAIFNPSIAVNKAGDVIINFTASGASIDPAAYYIVAGPNQTFGAPTLYQSSDAPMVSPLNSAGLVRWGTYSSAVADPNNPNGFWISNEYVQSGLANNFSEPAWWSTVTSDVIVAPAPAAPTIASQVGTGSIPSGVAEVTGSGDAAGDTVTLYVGQTAVGSGAVDINGKFDIKGVSVGGASAVLTAVETNRSGAASPASAAFTIFANPVSAAIYLGNAAALDKITGGFAIADTAANIETDIGAIEQDAQVKTITLTGAGTVTVAVGASLVLPGGYSQTAGATDLSGAIIGPVNVGGGTLTVNSGATISGAIGFSGLGGTFSELGSGATYTVTAAIGTANIVTLAANDELTVQGVTGAGSAGALIATLAAGDSLTLNNVARLGTAITASGGNENIVLMGNTGATLALNPNATGDDITLDGNSNMGQIRQIDISGFGAGDAMDLAGLRDAAGKLLNNWTTLSADLAAGASGVATVLRLHSGGSVTFDDQTNFTAAEFTFTPIIAQPKIESQVTTGATSSGTGAVLGAGDVPGDTITLTEGQTPVATGIVAANGSFDIAGVPVGGASAVLTATESNSFGSVSIASAPFPIFAHLVSVATYAANTTALDAVTGGFAIADTAASVEADIGVLGADAQVKAITLTGAGTVTIAAGASLALPDGYTQAAGVTNLSGALNGPVNIDGGTLTATSTGAIGGAVTLDGGTLTLDAGATVSGAIGFSGAGGVFDDLGANTFTITGAAGTMNTVALAAGDNLTVQGVARAGSAGGLTATLAAGDTLTLNNVMRQGTLVSASGGNDNIVLMGNAGGTLALNPSATGDNLTLDGNTNMGEIRLVDVSGFGPGDVMDLAGLKDASGALLNNWATLSADLANGVAGGSTTVHLYGGGGVMFDNQTTFSSSEFKFG